jgi:recombination protein RecR
MSDIDHLIQLLAKLPGFGPRSARRAALHLLKHRDTQMEPLARALTTAAQRVVHCPECGMLDSSVPCVFCASPKRDRSTICVVEEVSDVWAFERSGTYQGLYHVLGGTLSALDGIRPEDLRIQTLVNRASAPEVLEVILATSFTIDGQTTTHYIVDRLGDVDVKISGIAHGVPLGGELEYLDDATLSAAIDKRRGLTQD